jgi:predicted PurR-regulated permease PerM
MAGQLGGVIGMILAIPTYTFIRIIAKEFFSNWKIVQTITKDI